MPSVDWSPGIRCTDAMFSCFGPSKVLTSFGKMAIFLLSRVKIDRISDASLSLKAMVVVLRKSLLNNGRVSLPAATRLYETRCFPFELLGKNWRRPLSSFPLNLINLVWMVMVLLVKGLPELVRSRWWNQPWALEVHRDWSMIFTCALFLLLSTSLPVSLNKIKGAGDYLIASRSGWLSSGSMIWFLLFRFPWMAANHSLNRLVSSRVWSSCLEWKSFIVFACLRPNSSQFWNQNESALA